MAVVNKLTNIWTNERTNIQISKEQKRGKKNKTNKQKTNKQREGRPRGLYIVNEVIYKSCAIITKNANKNLHCKQFFLSSIIITTIILSIYPTIPPIHPSIHPLLSLLLLTHFPLHQLFLTPTSPSVQFSLTHQKHSSNVHHHHPHHRCPYAQLFTCFLPWPNRKQKKKKEQQDKRRMNKGNRKRWKLNKNNNQTTTTTTTTKLLV